MKKEKLLEIINTNLEYNFYPDEHGFYILTHTRYRNLSGIKAAYFKSFDGKIFKLVCKEISKNALPKAEKEVLDKLQEDEK